ncbi:MAG: hypothetical protein KatS3mg028_0065 [Bacteroidia bacterium]|nr:MAG: hypothetical protein KatS3mg028_0065 [Bacteroidia bacterium]
MFIYSVTVSINKEIEKEWLDWMIKKHIPDVLNTGCFTEYNLFQVYSAFSEDVCTYNIQYAFNSVDDLENYQKNFASRLQKEHSDKFHGQFTATRTVLRKIQTI